MSVETDENLASLRERKHTLRREMLERRRMLPAEERKRASEIVRARTMEQPEVREAATVMLYASTQEELDLFPLMEAFLRAGKRIALPYIVEKGHIEARLVLTIEELVEGAYGILAPNPAQSGLVLPEEIDVVIVPGAAFAEDGGRLGLGGGYYDRFLPRAAHALRLALAYDFQVIPRIPMASHDAYVDCILTERRFLRPYRGRYDKTFEEEV